MAGIMLIPAFVQAQEYTLKQCLELALKSNTRIEKARYDYEEGEQKTREVKAQALPQVNGKASFTDNLLVPAFIINNNGTVSVLKAGLQYGTSISAEAQQQLFNQSVFTGIKAAKVSEEYYAQNLERVEEEIIQQTATQFLQAVSVEAKKVALESSLKEIAQNLKIAEQRYSLGLGRKVDVDRLRVNYTNIKTQLLSLDDSYSQAINQLKLTMGVDIATAITLDAPLLHDTTTYQYDPNLVEGDMVWENKIEFKQLSTQLKLWDLEKQSFASGYYPTLSAYANYARNGASQEFNFAESNATTNWYSTSAIGLNLSIPIFDGFRKSAQMQQSKIRHMKTERDMSFTKQQSNMQYTNSRNAFATHYANYLAQKQNADLALEVLHITQQNFNEGVSPLTDLLNAESAQLNAQNQLIEALLKVKQAEIDLLKAKGEIKTLLI